MSVRRSLCFLLLFVLALPALSDEPAAALRRVFADYDAAALELNPFDATRRGDARFDDRLQDGISPQWLARDAALQREFLLRLDAIDRARLSPADRVSHETFRFTLQLELDKHTGGFAARESLMPLSQFDGMHLDLPRLGSGSGMQPLATEAGHAAWLQRAAQWPAWVEQAIANMRKGMREGVVLPRALVERLLPQLDAQIVARPEDSVFYGPVKALPEGPLRARLAPRYVELIRLKIVPGYLQLRDFVADEYLPATRAGVARSELPDGKSWYAHDIRTHTTLALDADRLHRTGLEQMILLQREMDRVRQQLGFEGNLRQFFDHLRTNTAGEFGSGEEALAAYGALKQTVAARLPALFGRLPRAEYEVREVEAFRAASAAGGSYQRPDAGGLRPGIFYLNTVDLSRIPRYETTSLSLHEAVPGHHFQNALAIENTALPEFQRFGFITAFGEGWALYAETLGKEMGLYDDPQQYLGYLHNRLYRANRLVIDTGLHAFGWTRERAIRHFLDNSPMSEADATAEVERYIAWPGQALAYLTGAMTIAELRAEASERLGPRFELRAFHDTVLGSGIVPLPVLQANVRRWVEERTAPAGAAS